jgi:hypothetical protein
MKTLSWSVGIALFAAAVCVPSASAETVKCQRTIAKASSQFVQAKVKALSKCNGAVIKNGSGSCPDQKTSDAITKASTKLSSAIGKSCGGDDKVCGGDLTHEDLPATLGWPALCPDFDRSAAPACTGPINNCGDIAACVECVGESAVDQSVALYYADLALPSTSNAALNKCQIAIGKAASAFLSSKTKALQKCWDAKLNGGTSIVSCVPPASGDGKYIDAILKAAGKQIDSICKACSGVDKTCRNLDDLTPVAIGFASQCPSVTIPGTGRLCGASIANLGNLIDCVDCITEFNAEGVDQLQVPQYIPSYPAEFGACSAPAPRPGSACPTTMEFNADGQKVDLDTGWKGLAHNAQVPTNGRITLNVSGCAGTTAPNHPDCGQCNVNGPIENAGGVTFSNHRCQDQPWVQCSTTADCTNHKQCTSGTNGGAACTAPSECPGSTCDGATGPCDFFFGSPLPLVAGGVATCVLNRITGPVTGTININDGSSVTIVPLASGAHIGGGDFNPCPQCNAGLCTDGPRIAKACSVMGTSIQYGNVSLDCPPNSGSNVGTLSITLNIATGTQTTTLTTLSPKCRQTGYTDLRCFCDTCNEITQKACSSDAECPVSGGNPGICGGFRCTAGVNAGAPCTNETECPGGGLCGVPGEATQTNACAIDDSSTPVNESLCQDIGDNQGECPGAPIDKYCSIQKQHSCDVDGDCAPFKCSSSGAENGDPCVLDPGCVPPECQESADCPAGACQAKCPACLTGQICVASHRSCFTDNGVVGNSISVAGTPDVPCGGVSKPTVGSFFCVGPLGATSVNAAAGLPGFGRIRIPGIVVVNP